MAEDFRARVTGELDLSEAEGKLQQFLNNKKKLKIMQIEIPKFRLVFTPPWFIPSELLSLM